MMNQIITISIKELASNSGCSVNDLPDVLSSLLINNYIETYQINQKTNEILIKTNRFTNDFLNKREQGDI